MTPPDNASSNQSNGNSTSAGESAANAARKAASTAKREAKRQADSVYDSASSSAARTANETSNVLDDAAASLERSGHETLSQAAAGLADRVRDLSAYLKDRKLEDCMADARRLAQRNPALFIGGGIALGFALSRFFKASQDRDS